MVGQRWVVAALWVVGALAAGRPAAAEESEFDDIVAQALERYNAQEFVEAADLFQRAYEIRQEPELIFNTARAYERAAETERAIEAYERFLTLENTTAALRARAAENLSALRAELMARRRAAELEEAARRRPEGGGAGGEGGEGGGAGEGGEGGEGPVGPTPPTPEERAARIMTITGWSLVGVGAATLVGAGIAAGLAYASYSEFQDASVEDDRAGMREATEQRALAADIMFGVGGAVAAAGAVLLIVQAVQAAGRAEEAGEEPAPPEAEVAFVPAATAGGVGVFAVGRF